MSPCRVGVGSTISELKACDPSKPFPSKFISLGQEPKSDHLLPTTARVWRTPCPGGKLDALLMFPRARAAIHIPRRDRKGPQAYYDGPVLDCSSPRLHVFMPQAFRQFFVALHRWSMAGREQIL